jgi:Tol biopolymer transport system component
VIWKPFRLTLYVLFLTAILVGCTNPTKIATLPPLPTDIRVPAIKTLPPPTDTPVVPTQTKVPSPTASVINGPPLIELVSVSSDGMQGNADSYNPAISGDGRFVVFASRASNLVKGDNNGEVDIFVHDMKTGETTRVSVASDGMQGNESAGPGPAISADGRYVAFSSIATNLVDGDTNGVNDVFVHDRKTRETTRVSVASDGTQANNWSAGSYCMGGCSVLSISAGGRYVTFNSAATNLVEGDTDKGPKIFVHDRVTGETIMVPVPIEPQEIEKSFGSSISADGRYVAFESWYPFDVFLFDRVTGETTRVSASSDGIWGNSRSTGTSISIDGRYVAFSSYADNLVKGDTNNICDINGDGVYDESCSDVFVHDRITGENIRVSVSSDGSQANADSGAAIISVDGHFVTFTSNASNLVEGDTNGVADVFVDDRVTGDTIRVSVAGDGTQGNGNSDWSSISADGRYVAYASNATNLVEGDINGFYDIFVRDLGASKQPVASWDELYGIWSGSWSTGHSVLMEFIATMRPRVGFEEAVIYPGDDIGREWFNIEGGILTFGDWINGAWIKPFSASTDCINNPQATYEVYITSQDDLPEKLHFVLVGEDHCLDRQTFLDGQTLTWVGSYPP